MTQEYSSAEVAEILGLKRHSVHVYYKKYGIGRMFKGRLLFTKKDIKKIRATDGRRRK